MGFLGLGRSRAKNEFDTAYQIGQYVGDVVVELNRDAEDGDPVGWYGVFAETNRKASLDWKAGHEFSRLDKCEVAETVLGAAYDDANEEDCEDFIAGFESKTDPWWKFW